MAELEVMEVAAMEVVEEVVMEVATEIHPPARAPGGKQPTNLHLSIRRTFGSAPQRIVRDDAHLNGTDLLFPQ